MQYVLLLSQMKSIYEGNIVMKKIGKYTTETCIYYQFLQTKHISLICLQNINIHF